MAGNMTATETDIWPSEGILSTLLTLAPDHNTTTLPTPPIYLQQVKFMCNQVLMPLVVSFGILGNILSLIVLTRKEMASPTNCFLTALGVSDLLLLLVQIPHFFSFNSNLMTSSSFKIFYNHYYILRYVMTNVFITCTCWITVAVTIERFISLRFMMHKRLSCNIPRAKKAIIGIFLVSALFHISKFFDHHPNPDLQDPRPVIPTDLGKNKAYTTNIHILNISLVAIIPVFLLVIVNSFLIYFLATHRKRMMKHKAGATSSVDMMHISFIVVAMVLVFIMCHSLGVFLALNIAANGTLEVFSDYLFRSFKHVNNLLVMFNSSVNFLLYCTISKKFRSTFATIFLGRLLSKKMSWSLQVSTNDQSMSTKQNGTSYGTTYMSQTSTSSSNKSGDNSEV